MHGALLILPSYRDRQVIVNWYEDGELVGKEGYRFDRVEVDGYVVRFVRDTQPILTIDGSRYPQFAKVEGFPNHFAFTDNGSRLELYFST